MHFSYLRMSVQVRRSTGRWHDNVVTSRATFPMCQLFATWKGLCLHHVQHGGEPRNEMILLTAETQRAKAEAAGTAVKALNGVYRPRGAAYFVTAVLQMSSDVSSKLRLKSQVAHRPNR